ncbi:MAG: cell wall-binding repeat-containing protein [Desulfosporosinus sp.]
MKKRNYLSFFTLVVTIITLLLVHAILALANQPSNQVERLAGNTRFQTMWQIASKFPRIVDNVVLTTGNNYPDALAGVPLAHQKEGPLLLLLDSQKFSI